MFRYKMTAQAGDNKIELTGLRRREVKRYTKQFRDAGIEPVVARQK